MDDKLTLYHAIGWVGNAAGQRITLRALDTKGARHQIELKYGANVVATIHNDEDARRPRQAS